mmetsp:Transcript_5952/g.13876  ORF Transcript_5952/g.13876 Transcript_5952/m.13876 type:complete len:221 (+) Transcript_5952:3457-4119(+)
MPTTSRSSGFAEMPSINSCLVMSPELSTSSFSNTFLISALSSSMFCCFISMSCAVAAAEFCFCTAVVRSPLRNWENSLYVRRYASIAVQCSSGGPDSHATAFDLRKVWTVSAPAVRPGSRKLNGSRRYSRSSRTRELKSSASFASCWKHERLTLSPFFQMLKSEMAAFSNGSVLLPGFASSNFLPSPSPAPAPFTLELKAFMADTAPTALEAVLRCGFRT